jgi:flagellar hook-basal body complex protein FliE
MADITNSGVQELLAQMRAMAAQAQSGVQPTNASATEVPDFSNMLKNSIDKVNETQNVASDMATAFQKGDPNVDIADVMVEIQKASVSFQAMVQVRNRLVSAYQDIMNMPV